MNEPITDSEKLRRQVDEPRQTAQRLIEEAARLLAKSPRAWGAMIATASLADLEKQISATDKRRP
jgi:hypothetical protein